jgi:type I restriction enzyme R subunit
MSNIGKPERATQDRIFNLFRNELGYDYLGDKSDQQNSNIEENLLSA